MKIKYINWNYGERNGEKLHLIRLINGKGLLKSSEEVIRLGLAKWKYA